MKEHSTRGGVDRLRLWGTGCGSGAIIPIKPLSQHQCAHGSTLDLLKLDMPEAATHYKERLYHAAPEVFFNVLKSATGQAILIIAHNLGIAEFAERVAKTRPQHIGFEHYPTCATWVADFDIKDWSALQMHSGRTTDFCVPREL